MQEKRKILIAEDEDDQRELLTMLLSRAGYRVVSAPNGRSALYAIERDPDIDVVLLDWMMPDIDGVQVVRDLRLSICDRYIYVIMVTALSSHANVKTAIEAGADDYVTKPFDPSELLARLQTGTAFAMLKNDIMGRLKEVDKSLSAMQNKIS